MSITLDLPPEIEAKVLRQAQARQVTPEDYISDLVISQPEAEPRLVQGSEEWWRVYHEAASVVDPAVPPLSDYAVSREGLYEDHD